MNDAIQPLDDATVRRVLAQTAPGAFYMRGEDNFRLTTFGSLAGVVLEIRSRILLPDGTIMVSADRHVPSSTRVAVATWLPTPEGWVLGAELLATVGAPRVGQVFAVLDVVRGDATVPLPVHTLLQGYVTDTSRLAYPGSPLRTSIEGPGVIRSIAGTDPPAGVEVFETVPTNARWRLLSFDVALVTSAAVANREVTLTIDDGAAIVAEVCSAVAQAATLTRRYSFTRNVQRGTPASGTVVNAPAPDIVLMGGFHVRTATTLIDGGDNFGVPQLLVEEWIED